MNYELLGIYLSGLSLVVLVGSLMFALIETLLLNRVLMIGLDNRSRFKYKKYNCTFFVLDTRQAHNECVCLIVDKLPIRKISPYWTKKSVYSLPI